MRARPYRQTRTDVDVDAAAARPDGATLLPILQHVQQSRGWLSSQVLGAAADRLHVPDAQAFGVATFYSMLSTEPGPTRVVRVCEGPVCALRGGGTIREKLEVTGDHSVRIEPTSCLGLCDRAPAALVDHEACGPLLPERLGDIRGGWRGTSPEYGKPLPGETRIALARLGQLAADDLQSARQAGAYQTLARSLSLAPARLRQVITDSGLQGRGGAGFPTGKKWQLVAAQAEEPKYVVCNADESEPAAFKDRVLLECDPHLLLEGLALAAFAVGAREGIVYIRGEYEAAARILESAIQQAEQQHFLGEEILGTAWSFRVRVHRGAGAYICGEETALLESLEGRRGEPRVRPPYPTVSGWYGRPTVVNNVETLCKVPAILTHGSDWYRRFGTANSPGTKLFTVTGHVNRVGVFEAPFGITLGDVIDTFAGGMRAGSTFQMALTGGAAGTIVGPAALDIPLDFAAIHRGVALGSGAIVVMDQTVSVWQLLRWLLHFFETESCGKCTPCREGTREARVIIERLESGTDLPGDLETLGRLSRVLRLTSFCGLGQSVAWPLDSGLALLGVS